MPLDQAAFASLIKQVVSDVYPKGKLRTAAGLTPEELKSPRFDDPQVYDDLKKIIAPPIYILVSPTACDDIQENLLPHLPQDIICYCSQTRQIEAGRANQRRILFMNSDNPQHALIWEGVYGADGGVSNEKIRHHFEALMREFPLRIEEVSINAVAGAVTEELAARQAQRLAQLMFTMNPDTANFTPDDDTDEEGMNFEEHSAYFIDKLTRHLINDRTFYYRWD